MIIFPERYCCSLNSVCFYGRNVMPLKIPIKNLISIKYLFTFIMSIYLTK